MRVSIRVAECHPDRKHYAKGLCQSCYEKTRDRPWTPECSRSRRDRRRKQAAEYLLESRYWPKLKTAILGVFGTRARLFKVVGHQYQESGISDILGCICGKYIAIELKGMRLEFQPGQKEFLRSIENAGGIAWIVRTNENPDEVATRLLETLRREGLV